MNHLNGGLRAEITAHGLPMRRLTVLSEQNDPFRLDTPASHRDGQWLADQVAALGLSGTIHLRGLHYALMGRIRPDGRRYINDDPTWSWLENRAAKAARWLGYLPWERVVDQRNALPVIRLAPDDPWPWLDLGRLRVELPDDIPEPRARMSAEPRQAFRFVLFGEKSSLEPVLGAVAERYGADLFLPTGEISDTLMHTMARNAADDGRPLVVFTFSDCDPAGWQMPVSIARKLQAFSTLFGGFAFQVRRVGLLPEHVKAHGLPSTPLKEEEKRADKWRAATGVEQTEIDALAALRPEVLDALADAAFAPFFDATLAERVDLAASQWEAEATARLADLVGPERLAEIQAERQRRLDEMREEIARLNDGLRVPVDDLELPAFVAPEPVVTVPEDPPLIDSCWTFPEQCAALIGSKRYAEGATR